MSINVINKFPGPIIDEIKTKAKVVTGVATSNGALYGMAERGPIESLIFTLSWAEWSRIFGDVDTTFPMSVAAYQFYRNGGVFLYTKRVVNYTDITDPDTTSAVKATGDLLDTEGVPGTRLTVNAKYHGVWYNGLNIAIDVGSLGVAGEFKLTITHDTNPGIVEVWDNLSLDSSLENYVVDIINDSETGSDLIEIVDPATGFAIDTTQTAVDLASGSDGAAVTDSDYNGDKLARTGIFAFQVIVSLPIIIGCPDTENDTNIAVTKAMVDYVETDHKFGFAVIGVPQGKSYLSAITYVKTTLAKDATRAAAYYPNVKLEITKTLESPTGSLMGIYARYDNTPGKGVWWSPAGVDASILGVSELEFDIDENQGGLLNENRVNNISVIGDFGIVVWGARTLTLTEIKDFRYIGPRRNTNFVEASIKAGTLWATMLPNDEDLWQALRLTIDGFLFRHWVAGGLKGVLRSDAYYVICDDSLNIGATIDQGKVLAEFGIRNKKTAEFVISRVVQLPSGIEVV